MGYYSEKLAGLRLKQCYDLATPRIKQYLDSEIEHILSRVIPQDTVLELGCGYGRVMIEIEKKAQRVYGIDTAEENIEFARSFCSNTDNCDFLVMDALRMAFSDNTFDVSICIQNGIRAFHVDPFALVSEAVRVTKPEGKVIFSSYSDKIWQERLKWFEIQSKHGLLGEIDFNATRDGTIVCKDGFSADSMNKKKFQELGRKIGLPPSIEEVDESIIFCEFTKNKTD